MSIYMILSLLASVVVFLCYYGVVERERQRNTPYND